MSDLSKLFRKIAVRLRTAALDYDSKAIEIEEREHLNPDEDRGDSA